MPTHEFTAQQNGTNITKCNVPDVDEKTMAKIDKVAEAVGFAVEWCSSFAVAALIKQNVVPNNRRQRIYIIVGGYAVGAYLGTHSGQAVANSVRKVLISFATTPVAK